MITLRKSNDRGHANHGWLDSRHTFSFGDYHDPHHMGFSVLRVINEDRVRPAQGFGTHPHQNMEIISYVLEGELEHKDSMGNGSVIRAGDVQHMSAGSGVTHSEFNPSKVSEVHFLQIWIRPNRMNVTPRYAQKNFNSVLSSGKLTLIASESGDLGSIPIYQDARLFGARFEAGQSGEMRYAPGRRGWLQLVSGSLEANGLSLSPGDGAAIESEELLNLRATASQTEFLLFDLP